MRHFVVTARITPGHEEEVLRILEESPPFDLEATSLERHMVFVADDELVFVFEGEGADEEAARLLEGDDTLERAGRLAPYIEGTPVFPRELFCWERPQAIEGLFFGPDPGPGDSDGGGRDE